MRGRVADTAPEKINLWETSKISKITRHSFKNINCVKLQYIMLDPPQLFCLLALRAICVITLQHTLAKVIPLHILWQHIFLQFKHPRLNTVHFSVETYDSSQKVTPEGAVLCEITVIVKLLSMSTCTMAADSACLCSVSALLTVSSYLNLDPLFVGGVVFLNIEEFMDYECVIELSE